MNEGARVDWGRFPARYLPLALLLIPLVLHAAMMPVTSWLEGGLPWSAWLTPDAAGLHHSPADRGWGTLTGNALTARIATNALVGVVIVSVLAFFEEIGWRGWLLPRLIERIGARRAVVATAIIAALWHTPYAQSGIHHFAGIDAATVALFAPIGHIGAGLVIGWLWLRTESIWIVSIAHGALNNWGQYAFKYMDGPVPADEGAVLSAGIVALLIVGVLLLWLAPGRTNAGQAAEPRLDRRADERA
jgi:membrane protease YdiL (CAAX protease family)